MEVLPENMIYEIMRWLGPDIWAFIQANKRILGIFGQNRATLEYLKIRYLESPVIVHGITTKFMLIILENSLIPHKSLIIESNQYACHDIFYQHIEMCNDIWGKLKSKDIIVFTDETTSPGYKNKIVYDYAKNCISSLSVNKESSIFVCTIWRNVSAHKYSGEIEWENNDLALLKDPYNDPWVYKPSHYKNVFRHILKFDEVPEWVRETYSNVILGLEGIFGRPGNSCTLFFAVLGPK